MAKKNEVAKKDSKKKKKEVEPALEAIKKPLSGYMIFTSEKRKEILKKEPNLKITEVAKKVGEEWGKSSEKIKEHYN